MKKLKLTQVEQEKLKNYRVRFEDENIADYSVSQLLNKQVLEDFIDNLQIKLAAPDRRVTTSMFSKRYAYLMAVAPLYSFSVFNKLLNVTKDNLLILPSNSTEYWLPEIYLINQDVLCSSTNEERKVLREQLVKNIFSGHLNKIWDCLSKIGKVPKQILWENTCIYIFWLYETLLEETEDGEVKDRIKDDFQFILFEAEGVLFGDYQKNPLTKFYHQKSVINGEPIRVRRTCCFYYQLAKDGAMCSTCPRKC